MINKDWTLEQQVDDYVKDKLNSLGVSYTIESNMSDYMKEALKGGAKTQNKTNFGKPDFEIEEYVSQYKIPTIIENKLGIKKLKKENKSGIKQDDKSISGYAVNGGLHYARTMVDSGKYPNGVVFIGIAGNNPGNIEIEVYYVYGSEGQPKYLSQYKNLNFLENVKSYGDMVKAARLTDEEKHKILIDTNEKLHVAAKNLNILMNDLSIPAGIRVIYVSGCLLSMQQIGGPQNPGLVPSNLTGSELPGSHDGDLIVRRVNQFLGYRHIPDFKVELMMSYFNNIQSDPDREKPIELKKQVSKLLTCKASTNKQIFTYIYENVFRSIDGTSGHLDIMGSMYSEFLKYALGDGKNIGIVLTPPYITKLMTELINVNMNSRVMDLATGSAGFLISSMEIMIQDANENYGRDTTKAKDKIEHIKHDQLLGIELDPQMYTLATTNMILRGDGSSQIKKGDSFTIGDSIINKFEPDRLLLNPPFSFKENGMPFVEYGMRYMHSGGRAAIIVQDSAGSGKAIETNKQILKKNTLLYSIKMPTDLFQPSAGVQTSIYVFATNQPHDFDSTVRFIDFRNDGYKRTGRGINEVDHPRERYRDILKIAKAGRNAKLEHKDLWNLNNQVFDDQINDSGKDWNLEAHQVIDISPTDDDFMTTVGDYISWEVSNLIKELPDDKI